MSAASALLSVCLLVGATSVHEVPNPRSSGRWVSDLANVLDAPARDAMESRLVALERDLGVEIAVVTVKHVEVTPKEFATALFKHWGIGKAGTDNGLLVLLVMDQRRLEMETGYGLEGVLPDGWLGSMQQEAMVPLFKAGQFGAGVAAGLARVDEKLRLSGEEVQSHSRNPTVTARANIFWRAYRAIFVTLGWILAGLLALVGFFLWRRHQAIQERTCQQCHGMMELMPESKEDKYLTPGQQTEERIGSVLYDVFWCFSCGIPKVVARNKWFSGHSTCSRCSNKTLTTSTTTITRATEHSTGLIQVDERCKHCNFQRSYQRTTPRVVVTSSSSSSGGRSSGGGSSGGSFGGGRSGGGGAGSSW